LIRARIDAALAEVLLERHVGRRAEEHAGSGQGSAVRRLVGHFSALGHLHRLLGLVAHRRQAEIADPRAGVRVDEHVVGLEVAVDDPGRVGGGEPFAGGAEHGEHLAEAPRLLLEPAPERAAGDVLHRDEHLMAVAAEIMDRYHVRVREPRQRLRLAHEAPPLADTIARLAEQLYGDLTIESVVVGRVDDAHGPLTDTLEQDIALQRRAEGQLGCARPLLVVRRADADRLVKAHRGLVAELARRAHRRSGGDPFARRWLGRIFESQMLHAQLAPSGARRRPSSTDVSPGSRCSYATRTPDPDQSTGLSCELSTRPHEEGRMHGGPAQ
jgi:hypothetical protein